MVDKVTVFHNKTMMPYRLRNKLKQCAKYGRSFVDGEMTYKLGCRPHGRRWCKHCYDAAFVDAGEDND